LSDTNQPNEVASDRRRRVNRLKKMIIITALILIIIPIILCVFLMIKVSSLQKTVDELMDLKQSGAIVAQKNDSGKTYYVYASDLQKNEQTLDYIIESKPLDNSNDIASTDDAGVGDIIVDDTQDDIEKEEQVDTGKYVYLTFDDGPSIQTEKILEILDEHNVKATFFVVGKSDEESYARYKAIVDSGNSIGLHSYTHDYAQIYASVENFEADLNRISDTVYEATGVRTMLYRFPGGSSNSIADDIYAFTKYLTEHGYTYYDWNSSSRDAASVMPTKEAIIETVLSEVDGKDNVVVLMHDSARKESTVEALPELIVKLKEMGYTIKGLDENSKPVQHR